MLGLRQIWPTGPAYPQATAPAAQPNTSLAPLPALSYRDVFKDVRLQTLIDRALADNQNLRAALANVEIARAQYRVQRHVPALLPLADVADSVGSMSSPAVGQQPAAG